ncbi:hypothetical protein [Helicobacter sp. T3_23-1059]
MPKRLAPKSKKHKINDFSVAKMRIKAVLAKSYKAKYINDFAKNEAKILLPMSKYFSKFRTNI